MKSWLESNEFKDLNFVGKITFNLNPKQMFVSMKSVTKSMSSKEMHIDVDSFVCIELLWKVYVWLVGRVSHTAVEIHSYSGRVFFGSRISKGDSNIWCANIY